MNTKGLLLCSSLFLLLSSCNLNINKSSNNFSQIENESIVTTKNAYNYSAPVNNKVETTLGIEETPQKEQYTGGFLDLSVNKVALMSYFVPTNGYSLPKNAYTKNNGETIDVYGTTAYSSTILKSITLYTNNSGNIYIGTALIKDIYLARKSAKSYSVNNYKPYPVSKGLNKINLNMVVASDSTVVLGGNSSVGIYFASGIELDDNQGNFSLLDGNPLNLER